jgi:hypothetical protein
VEERRWRRGEERWWRGEVEERRVSEKRRQKDMWLVYEYVTIYLSEVRERMFEKKKKS